MVLNVLIQKNKGLSCKNQPVTWPINPLSRFYEQGKDGDTIKIASIIVTADSHSVIHSDGALEQPFITCLMVPPLPQSSMLIQRSGVDPAVCPCTSVSCRGEPLGKKVMGLNRALLSCSSISTRSPHWGSSTSKGAPPRSHSRDP